MMVLVIAIGAVAAITALLFWMSRRAPAGSRSAASSDDNDVGLGLSQLVTIAALTHLEAPDDGPNHSSHHTGEAGSTSPPPLPTALTDWAGT